MVFVGVLFGGVIVIWVMVLAYESGRDASKVVVVVTSFTFYDECEFCKKKLCKCVVMGDVMVFVNSMIFR